MTIYGIFGLKTQKINYQLIKQALQRAPALFIDSANCTNPHLFTDFELIQLCNLEIIPAESLYRFKPTIQSLANTKHNIIFIATFNHLFDFDNKEENANVFEACWNHIAHIAKTKDVYMAIQENTIHHTLAQKYGVKPMGHTASSERIVTDSLLQELTDYSKALRADERLIYARMLKVPLKHFGSISNASSLHTWALLLLSIQLEQQKQLMRLEHELLDLRRVQNR